MLQQSLRQFNKIIPEIYKSELQHQFFPNSGLTVFGIFSATFKNLPMLTLIIIGFVNRINQ